MINFIIKIIICNIIFLHLRTFVKLWELVDLRAFSPRPAPPRGFSPLPRPTLPRPVEKKAALHIPALFVSLMLHEINAEKLMLNGGMNVV